MAPTLHSIAPPLRVVGVALAVAAAGVAWADDLAADTARYPLVAPSSEANQGLTPSARDGIGGGWLGWIGRSVSDAYVAPRADTRLHVGSLSGVPTLRPQGPAATEAAAVWLERGRWFAGASLSGTSPVSVAPAEPWRAGGDTYTLNGGYMWRDRQSLSLQVVRDNRPSVEQRSINLVYGSPMAHNQWLRVGVSSITSFTAGMAVQRIGLSVGYDWPRYFVQLAYDPKTGLLAQDALRISAGTRF